MSSYFLSTKISDKLITRENYKYETKIDLTDAKMIDEIAEMSVIYSTIPSVQLQ